MTQRFLKAFDEVLKHEGGYNNVIGDAGGATNWGISLALLTQLKMDINKDGHVDYIDIQKLTKEDAQIIYWNNFWRPFLDILSEKIAIKMFDVSVNTGNKRANIFLQKAVNDNNTSFIGVDGIIGSETLNQVSKISEDKLLKDYCKEQLKFYQEIVKNNPSQNKFLKGWTNRANWLPV